MFFMLFICHPAQATFLLSDEKEFGAVPEKAYSHPQLGIAHLLPKAELESGICTAFRQKHIQAIRIPQTCWDLFAVLNHYRKKFAIPGTKAVGTEWVRLSNGLIHFIRSDPGRLASFQNGQFGEITRSLAREINNHLNRYHCEVKKISGVRGDSVEFDSSMDTKMWLYAHSHFPQLEKILVHATAIEQSCYERDEIPLWRHSRTSIPGGTDKDPPKVIDIPLYFHIEHLEDGRQQKKLALGTMSYGFSLLANYIHDGEVGTICNYNPLSACTFSYFMQHIRDEVYVDQGLPFYVFGEIFYPRESAAKKIRRDSILSVVRMPKSLFKAHYEHDGRYIHTSESYNWFMPLIHSTTWVHTRGEAAHPRHKGTALKQVEKKNDGISLYQISAERAIKSNQDLFALAIRMVQQTHMHILAIGYNIVTDDTDARCVKLLSDREAFTEQVLKSPNATELLRPILKTTNNGIDFF